MIERYGPFGVSYSWGLIAKSLVSEGTIKKLYQYFRQVLVLSYLLFRGFSLFLFVQITVPLKYQYWLQVVPTDIQTSYSRRKTQQYSVRDYARPVKKGEMQGIYFKYDFSAMRVRIEDDGEYFAMFLVRLSSIIGGIYITVGKYKNPTIFMYAQILLTL